MRLISGCPFAGYGMNAGFADAVNLSWKLAGVIKGWADPAILDTYKSERQPVTEQVSDYAMNTSLSRESLGNNLPGNLEEPGPAGDAARAHIGREAYVTNLGQFCCGGLNFGYFYENSPIIAYDGEQAPGYTVTTSASPRYRDLGRHICGWAIIPLTVASPAPSCSSSFLMKPLRQTASSTVHLHWYR